MGEKRNHGDDLRGASRLAVEATQAIVDVVGAMHETIAAGPAVLGYPLRLPTKTLVRPIYGGIRAVTDVVGRSLDAALAQLAPLLGSSTPGPERDAILAVLNGILGDYLTETNNPLALEMQLRRGGRPLVLEEQALREALPDALPDVGRKLLVLVHGSCMSDRQWNRRGHDHGAALAGALGYSPVYLLYNSGLHISTNGQAFAALLEQLVAAWPEPIDELILLAHSMGGLVSRSACHYGELAGHTWRHKLRALVCLGAPHHGAPLERGGNWFEVLLGVSRYSAPLARLGKLRSAGVTDMRFGNVVDEDWNARDRFARHPDCRMPVPLPAGVDCYAIAATTSPDPSRTALPNDGIVPVDSALGRCERPALTLPFPETHQWIAFGTGHLDLLDRRDVYAKIASWLDPDAHPTT
jgi:pimeloyl-ACP methyl ester carboxylesterase